MGWWEDFWGGKTTQVGSASDVSMLNQGGFDDFMKQLTGANQGFGQGFGQYGGQAGQAYQDVLGNAGNYGNFIQSMLGGQGLSQQMSQATGGYSPTAQYNTFMSQQPQMAQLANQNVTNALSDVYSTGRNQAQGAADTARRQAASDLAAAGLLRTGAGVGAMTKATAQPMMEMETNLANMRSQAFQNQLGQLQGQGAQALGQGYQTSANMGQLAQQLGLQGLLGQSGVQQAGAAGMAGLAGLYGGLQGQGLGLGAQMNQPQYYTPQYQQGSGFGDVLTGILSSLASFK